MNSLDHLGWVDGLSVVSHGVRVGIRVDEPSLLSRVAGCLPPGSEATRSPDVDHLYSLSTERGFVRRGTRHFNLLYHGTSQIGRTLDIDEVLSTLRQHLHDLIAATTQTSVFVEEAAMVAWGSRAAVVVGGDREARSLLAAECVKAGASYATAASAVFDLDGRIAAEPGPGEQPLELRLLVVAGHEHGAAWSPQPVGPGQAVLSLVQRAPAARLYPQAVLPALRRAVTGPYLLAGRWGDAASLAGDVMARLTRPHPNVQTTQEGD